MDSRTVGSRELKTRLGAHLKRVRAGRRLIVTDRGEPVAELRPIEDATGLGRELATLAAEGVVTLPAAGQMRPFKAIRHRGRPLSDAVVEDREPRF
jgi:prevent-host-death family protein